ncbi:SAICAR synthase-like protein, partial [Aureobasidium melanogenum]
KGTTVEDLQSSAHRSSYRAWRQGQGRMAGKSIAESQGRNLALADNDVDRKIDAKMPKIDQGLNVRSRKTSHYLGLFKDHDSEHEKRRDKKDKEKHVEESQEKDQQVLSAINERNDHNTTEVPLPIALDDGLSAEPATDTDSQDVASKTVLASSTFEAEAEQKPLTTNNAEGRIAHQIPPSLLEEIRNHHIILGPSNSKAPSENLAVSESFQKVSALFAHIYSFGAPSRRNTSYIAFDTAGAAASTRSGKGG